MTSPAMHDLGAHALLAGYRAGALSPVEVTQSVLAHIARWEPQLHASYLLRPELALAQARASEARWQRGAPLGPLGIPGLEMKHGALRPAVTANPRTSFPSSIAAA